MTSIDVLARALVLVQQEHFDCPHCACAEAKGQLEDEEFEARGDDMDEAEMLDKVRDIAAKLGQFARNQVEILASDAPLVEATEALRPWLSEIVACPSPMSDARMREVLSEALASLQTHADAG